MPSQGTLGNISSLPGSLAKAPRLIGPCQFPSPTSAVAIPREIRHRSWIAWEHCLTKAILEQERCGDFFGPVLSDSAIDFKLPKKNALPGQILTHGKSVIEQLIQKHQPCTFKIGYTHNPHFRFRNPIYGYAGGVDRFEAMLVIFVSHETVGPSFTESALIQWFQSS